MTCNNCGNQAAYRYRAIALPSGLLECCDRCAELTIGDAHSPDVYWPGHEYESPNLTDKLGNPITLRSKQHKAQVMKELGVCEVGDKVRGAYAESKGSWAEATADWRRKQFAQERPKIQKVYKEWLERARG